jgi:AcrR family transcriptional regulator
VTKAVETATAENRRARGRPRVVIDQDDLLEVVEQLFADGGLDAVTVERAAEELGVSRATLYRSFPTKERLLGALLARMTDDVRERSLRAVTDDGRSATERLRTLMRVHFQAAIEMREYLWVFFDGQAVLVPEDYAVWRRFTQEYERNWATTLAAAAQERELALADHQLAAKLVIGMIIWVSRWYRPEMDIDADRLTDQAVQLLGGIIT